MIRSKQKGKKLFLNYYEKQRERVKLTFNIHKRENSRIEVKGFASEKKLSKMISYIVI